MSLNDSNNPIDPIQFEEKKLDINPEEIQWKRITEIFPEKNFKIFDNKIEFDDIKQGNIGNCYFLSAIAAMTEFPNLIEKIFKTKEAQNSGIYEIALFLDGQWQIVVIDDFIPVNNSGSPAFAKPNGNEVWVMLLEKAWAKVNGGYLNIIGGHSSDALGAMTGFPKKHWDIPSDYGQEKIEEIWQKISEADSRRNIICCGTGYIKNLEAEKVGIVAGHAYSLISAKSHNYKGELLRLLKIRNPWGNKEWKGDFSDSSDLWNEELNKIFGRETAKDDGIFFMKIEDFLKYFRSLHICFPMQEHSYTKIFDIKNQGIDITKPQTFSFSLKEKSEIALSINQPFYRYNRHLRQKDRPISLVLARVNQKDNSVEFIDGDYHSDDDPNIKINNLNPGKYLIWFYFNNNQDNERLIDNFYLNICCTRKFICIYEKPDMDFNIIKKIIISGVKKFEEKNIKNNPKFLKIDNQLQNTGIAYLIQINNTKDTYMKMALDSSNLVNMNLIGNDKGNEFEIYGAPNSVMITLGMKQITYGKFWFNLKNICYSTKKPFKEDPNNGMENEFSNTRKLGNLISEKKLNQKVADDFYDFITINK